MSKGVKPKELPLMADPGYPEGVTYDYVFPVVGTGPFPADHAYELYSALCRIVPDLHHAPGASSLWADVGILPITGAPAGHRAIRITPRSVLTIRAPGAVYPHLLRLPGERIEMGGCRFTVGTPRPRVLQPAPVLVSRLVVIKGFLEPLTFLEAVRRQLGALGVSCRVELLLRSGRVPLDGGKGARPESPYIRRTVRIRDRNIVGYALKLSGLAPASSLTVQIHGVGGRRKFGCGIFLPSGAVWRGERP